jgi:hypothetical protein
MSVKGSCPREVSSGGGQSKIANSGVQRSVDEVGHVPQMVRKWLQDSKRGEGGSQNVRRRTDQSDQ